MQKLTTFELAAVELQHAYVDEAIALYRARSENTPRARWSSAYHDARTFPSARVEHALETLWRAGAAQCEQIGHAWESDDWAGPDTGGMGCYCTRCGESHHVTLY